ncbi:uncharacterized protein A1O9_10168 [Exophiala aquamarina CBS 119918]|uniref:Uncharacterized protein n=1 Tax=Exophiala aquamarina CBS 119918 TaxID=1182545 RepID=A0A072P282_9EURO|nr:uncharacterized protein A1O9_10168 [Exophiala aquamarina CBS 119918]KEF53767.1 hypothetical protein A1O9_10168 [Exophiala aquamarina CBS 119918]
MRADYAWEVAEREELKAKATYDVLSSKHEQGLPDDYTNPEADSISVPAILSIYPTRSAWVRDNQSALQASSRHRKGLVVQIMYLNALRNTKAPLLLDRSDRINNAECETALVKNLRNWLDFCARVPHLSAQAWKRATWCELLETEYRKMEPEWIKFWDYQESAHKQLWSGGNEYRDKKHAFCTLLKQHCTKKLFLQRKILESTDVLPELYAPEIPWLDMDVRLLRYNTRDGMPLLKPIFFTAGNKHFMDSGMTVGEVEAEIVELSMELESDDGDDGDDTNNTTRIVEVIDDSDEAQ